MMSAIVSVVERLIIAVAAAEKIIKPRPDAQYNVAVCRHWTARQTQSLAGMKAHGSEEQHQHRQQDQASHGRSVLSDGWHIRSTSDRCKSIRSNAPIRSPATGRNGNKRREP